MLEPHEQPPEVVAVLVDPVVHLLHMRLLQIPDHLLLQLPRPFSRDDLQNWDATVHTMFHRFVQGPVDLLALVENVVEVYFMFGHIASFNYSPRKRTIGPFVPTSR